MSDYLAFRQFHLLELLNSYQSDRGPIDRFVHIYFRHHRALGSKDRAYIAQEVYRAIRFGKLLDHFCTKPSDWSKRLSLLQTSDIENLQKKCPDNLEICQSIPAPLFSLLKANFDKATLHEQCRLINSNAPISLRVNALKGSREELLKQLPREFEAHLSLHAPCGIVLKKRESLFSLESFRSGWFELQDEGSQLIAEKIEAKPGDWVIDLCAGSGGKSLALAPRLEGKGQMFLGDIRPKALVEAKVRLKRAGVQNAQTLTSDHPTWRRLKTSADWVLTDVPCSGTGTLRRNPDMKEKIDESSIARLIALQREIVKKAIAFLKPGGRICYATCSLLKVENQSQVDYFCSHYNLELCLPIFQTLIVENGPDGFFAAVMKKKS